MDGHRYIGEGEGAPKPEDADGECGEFDHYATKSTSKFYFRKHGWRFTENNSSAVIFSMKDSPNKNA